MVQGKNDGYLDKSSNRGKAEDFFFHLLNGEIGQNDLYRVTFCDSKNSLYTTASN